MRRFVCLALIFALCVSLFTLPANAVPATGAFSLIRLTNADLYSRQISGNYRVVDDQVFQDYLLAVTDLNFQCFAYINVMPFSTTPIILNDNQNERFTTISFLTGTATVRSLTPPVDPIIIGGVPFEPGSTISYSNLFYSIFPYGMNYNANATTTGEYCTYYLPKDESQNLLVADLSNSSITETLVAQLDGLTAAVSSINSYSSNISSYITQLYSQIVAQTSDIDTIASYIIKLNTACSNIYSRLGTIANYENISAEHLTAIDALLTQDMPTIIQDIEYGLDFLYSIDQKLFQISNKLSTIHSDLEKTNDYLEEITDHLNAEALKGYDTSTGMNFFELAGNVLGNGFNVIGSFFSYAFMSIAALLAPGLEGFDQIANIWSWNNSGYDPDYIVPDSGGG